MRRTAARVDANQGEIVDAFRRLGCSVLSLAQLGHGVPDLLVGITGRNVLVEVKNGAKPASAHKLTPDQKKFHENWRGGIQVIYSLADVPIVVKWFRKVI